MQTKHHIDNLQHWLDTHPCGENYLPGTPSRFIDCGNALREWMEETASITFDKAAMQREISDAEEAASEAQRNADVAEGQASDLRDLWEEGRTLLSDAVAALRHDGHTALLGRIALYRGKQPG